MRATYIPAPEGRKTRCTWHFNPQGLSAPRLAPGRRALLPHVFTLTPAETGAVVFCDTLCSRSLRTGTHPLGGAALCVVRTFLPLPAYAGKKAAERFTVFIFEPIPVFFPKKIPFRGKPHKTGRIFYFNI